jgi:DNA-binding XRE family transcriptional regulator
MNKPAIITTPSGDRMAVIPLDEYKRLVEAAEDADDVRAYDEAKRKLKSGEDELIPAEFANRILDGENKIRVFRDYRGMTASALAQAAEISPAYLSQIESGSRDGSFETIKKIAAALRISVDDLA